MENSNVYIEKIREKSYPIIPPYHPSEFYPEVLFNEISKEKNYIYQSVRNLLYLMGLDKKNFGNKNWNPLKTIIKPGNKVVIKPNLVLDNFKLQDSITTHPSIIRALIDYIIIALKGDGEIIVGDAPLQSCNFDELVRFTGLNNIIYYFKSKNINIDLIDFRLEKLIKIRKKNYKIEKIDGDPKGYKIVNLYDESALQNLSDSNGYKKFRVTNYNPKIMNKAHNQVSHKYLVSNSVLQADVVVNIPKIKTHKKAGITACLKNTVGISGHKDWLPHHRIGSYSEGGDEYLNFNLIKKILLKINEIDDSLLIKNYRLHNFFHYPLLFLRTLLNGSLFLFSKDRYFNGSWYGNDTLWRTIADLNKILFYSNKFGKMTNDIQRKIVYFCDGVISGEADGPLNPFPNRIGVIIGGFNPLMIDLAISELFNFNYIKIPQIFEIFKLKNYKISHSQPSDLKIISNYDNWNGKGLNELKYTLDFKPSSGWRNYIEKKKFPFN